MTTDITELAQSLKAAAEKATPGEWWADEVKNEGCYGSGDDCVEGFISYAIYGSDGQTLFDSLNSDSACISEEYDGEGHVAWDETAQRNAEFIALANPSNILALVEALEYYKSREERVISLVRDNSKSWDELYRQVEAKGKRNVELVEALEKAQQRIAELEQKHCGGALMERELAHSQVINKLMSEIDNRDFRIAELESHTVKPPVHPTVASENLDDETLQELIEFRRTTFEYHSKEGNKVQTIIHGVTLAALRELQERRKANSEPVAEVVSIYGDPEAFGEREIRPLVGIQQMPYGTKLYRHAQPAPVLPDELLNEIDDLLSVCRVYACRSRRNGSENDIPRTEKAQNWLRACRAAMLQAGNSPAQSDCCPAQNSVSPAQSPIDHGYRPECECPGCKATARICAELSANSSANPDCWCRTCRPVDLNDMRFIVCPDCGNKRCPRANDHRNACTGSNEPGQEGGAYPDTPQEVKP